MTGNVAIFLHYSDASRVAVKSSRHVVSCEVKRSDFGHCINARFKCGITAPLTVQEMEMIYGMAAD